MKRKITSYYSLMAIAVSLLVSCSNEEGIPESKNEAVQKEEVLESASGEVGSEENVVLKETTLEELGYNSDEAMYADGWTKVYAKEQSSKAKVISAVRAAVVRAASNRVREKLSSEQVKQLNLSSNKIKEIFKFNGTKPSGVTINNWYSSGAFTKFNLPDEYSWHAYVEAGEPEVDIIYLDKNDGYKTSEFTLINQGNVEDSFQRIVTYTEGKTSHWHVNVTAGVKMSGKAGIPLVAEGKVEVSLAVEAGGGGSVEKTESHTYNYFGKLPARSKRTIILRQRKRTSKAEYKVPVTINGYVGLNFDKKKNGHYFWRGDAYKLLQGKDEAQLGSINVDEVYDVEIIAGPAIPLD